MRQLFASEGGGRGIVLVLAGGAQHRWFIPVLGFFDADLQTPVVDGAGAGMGLGTVGTDDGQVALDHLEVGMAEEDLEGEGIPAVAQVGDGEGVAEAVGVDVGDGGAVPDAFEGATEVIGGEVTGGVGRADDEDGVVGPGFSEAGSDVAPESAGGPSAKVADTFLLVAALPLSSNVDGVGFEIKGADAQVA